MQNIYTKIKDTRISELRLDKDLKQREVASKLDVLENKYSKWERGVTDILLFKSNELANLYDCSLDYLFGLSNKNIKTDSNEINLELMCQRILTLRKEKNLTQAQVSKYIGFNQRTYAHYENGSRIPTIFKVYYIAVFYNISLDYIVGRSNKKEILI